MSDDEQQGRKKKIKLYSDKEVACYYFRRLDEEIAEDAAGGDRWQCVVCNVVRKKNSGYSNLMSHVHAKHPDYEAIMAKNMRPDGTAMIAAAVSLAIGAVPTLPTVDRAKERTSPAASKASENNKAEEDSDTQEDECIPTTAATQPTAAVATNAHANPTIASPVRGATTTVVASLQAAVAAPKSNKRKADDVDGKAAKKESQAAQRRNSASYYQEMREQREQQRFEVEQERARLQIAILRTELQMKEVQASVKKALARKTLREAGVDSKTIDELLPMEEDPRVVVM